MPGVAVGVDPASRNIARRFTCFQVKEKNKSPMSFPTLYTKSVSRLGGFQVLIASPCSSASTVHTALRGFDACGTFGQQQGPQI